MKTKMYNGYQVLGSRKLAEKLGISHLSMTIGISRVCSRHSFLKPYFIKGFYIDDTGTFKTFWRVRETGLFVLLTTEIQTEEKTVGRLLKSFDSLTNRS